MALKSSVYKANVSLSNLNTHFYEDISLTLVLHPSETAERLMFRLLAFLCCAHERLEFTVGLDDPDLPDIWQKDLTGHIEHWIEIGVPDEKKVKKALGRSNKVSVFTYNPFKAKVWFDKIRPLLINSNKINVYHFKETESGSLESLVERSMVLNCMIEDQQIFLSNNDQRVEIEISQNI